MQRRSVPASGSLGSVKVIAAGKLSQQRWPLCECGLCEFTLDRIESMH